MKSLLLLKHVRVENANAIAGLTYGFPAISHFLGFTHALSRQLEQAHGLRLGGCAVVVHQHQVQIRQPGGRGDHVFALSRNPLTKEGKTAPFNEEGRMHLDVSLLIECEFDADDLPFGEDQPGQDAEQLERWLRQRVPTLRLAGGTITALQTVRWFELTQDSGEQAKKQVRRTLMELLPGFTLIQRHDLLVQHHQSRIAQSAEAQLLDSLLDFVALQYQCLQSEEGKVSWEQLGKPGAGYLVPITVGYRAISDLYAPGSVSHSRDPETPFCFVESIYSIGQWLSPHRVTDFEQILWRHCHQDDLYLCDNGYCAPTADISVDYDLF